eukprot:TRINITY_DN30124_c0_g1_i1.p1 TRINITY_DN30124_c0_g1~~TRINITY_DN30124_c0_g1_i1.p1  ORF type:complete len:141 (-),score=24.04 TRINITY_DN30124_c0_g1_i1:421-843(-)
MTLVQLLLLVFAAATSADTIPGADTTYEVKTQWNGKGGKVTKGASVTVHATGSVEETGKKFWSTKDKGQKPFTYDAGVGAVIKGWDQGCLGMGVGEVRQLRIPSHEGYGERGFPAWGIPPKATLKFEIEVLSIKGGNDDL